MICKQCSTEFDEGMFCPECGTKHEINNEGSVNAENEIYQSDIAKVEVEKKKLAVEKEAVERMVQELQEKERIARESVEYERKEKERVMKELVEQKGIEKARLDNERVELEKRKLVEENRKKEMETRTVKGIVYETLEEAELAKKEHYMIDLLKERLQSEKKQENRQEILKDYKEEFQILEARHRFELIKSRVDKKVPFAEKANFIYGITVLITFVISMIAMSAYPESNNVFIMICFWWTAFGVWTWLVWKIVLFIKSRRKDYYKNIGDI